MRFVASVIAMLILTTGGCAKQVLPERSPHDATMFGPTRMRIHPIFTQVKDWTGDGQPDGIEALIEFQDRFDDPTKASGTAVFELFEYRPYNPDPRGERVTSPWTGSLLTIDEQKARWNRTLSTYSFRLAFDGVRTNRNYVLAASFDRSAGAGEAARFFDRIIIEAQRKEPTVASDDAPPIPATRPAKP
ncbi:MAG: hypothetical protein WBD40_16540 [Tepidisphaeraceae bacterium]